MGGGGGARNNDDFWDSYVREGVRRANVGTGIRVGSGCLTFKYFLRELQRRRETTGGWGEVEIEDMLAWAKYGVRSPKFVLCTAVLIG